MANLEKIAEDLSSLTVIEAAELSKMLEEKWGVSAAAPVAVAAAPGAAAGEAPVEKDEFDVILKSFGADSTRSLASFSPRLVMARTSLMTLIFFSPKDLRMASRRMRLGKGTAAAMRP